jgi:uncharacterized protein (UPF0248 family)
MMPIQDLLNRIRWDEEFGRGEFLIGYYDRVADRIVTVPLDRIHFPEEDHFGFDAIESDGSLHSIPFHRVRQVWRDGELIWHRDKLQGS